MQLHCDSEGFQQPKKFFKHTVVCTCALSMCVSSVSTIGSYIEKHNYIPRCIKIIEKATTSRR